MSVSVQLLWLLCGMGSAVFATGTPSIRRWMSACAGLAAAAWMLRDGAVPDAAVVATVTLVAAGWRIYRPSGVILSAACGGWLAGALATLMVASEIPAAIAWIAAAAVPGASLVLSRRKNFGPAPVVEEGTLLILALSFGAALVPAVLDGWQSARALNGAPDAAGQALPMWVPAMAAVFLSTGGAWSLWRHR